MQPISKQVGGLSCPSTSEEVERERGERSLRSRDELIPGEAEFRRRDLLRLLGLGGVVFASGLEGCGYAGAPAAAPAAATGTPPPNGDSRGSARPGVSGNQRAVAPLEDFFFLQLSDTHWGYSGPANPEAQATLPRVVAAINAVATKPDFVVFTGDLTHTTDDPKERRARLRQFREIVAGLAVPTIHFLPGEHDAAPDRGEAYQEAFGELYRSFDHKGIHFVAVDNASAPGGSLGETQLGWLATDLERLAPETPVVVLAHRPLFELYPQWEWSTQDGPRVIELLSRRANVTVFYGHIHQELHRKTGDILHHAARSLVFPLPAPGSVPKRAPLPWDAASHDHGLGWRSVALARGRNSLTEILDLVEPA